MPTLRCEIASVEAITNTIYRVRLTPEVYVAFRAGQYLILKIKDHAHLSFSIASTPMEKDIIELHIGGAELNSYIISAIEYIQNNKNIIVDIPYGLAWLREEDDSPLILIAGGTGFSYIRSILFTALARKSDRCISVYWGGREIQHLYDLDSLNRLLHKHSNLKIFPVLERTEYGFGGRKGTVISAVMKDYNCLSRHAIYIAGPVNMVKKAHICLCTERGANSSLIFGDALAFI
ncbi:NAD(P)H-flavin reductase [Candidatus Erwinia haradaeae]|uniref:NAD(P)H-flavin reductase n=1 Tax=Candidatus Erwinia haradaeae TaxID=1922217 RepID=A0A451DM36_9GAMM|nr:NAD(P)H-flavin reductase [Candidatus Erwinia haradaeae]VFP87789.1 NAD(P)H-flavin reductase [Candidatus Erwinia haradaeae]